MAPERAVDGLVPLRQSLVVAPARLDLEAFPGRRVVLVQRGCLSRDLLDGDGGVVEAEEAEAGRSPLPLLLLEALDGVEQTPVHGHAVAQQDRRERAVTGVGEGQEGIARAVPDLVGVLPRGEAHGAIRPSTAASAMSVRQCDPASRTPATRS